MDRLTVVLSAAGALVLVISGSYAAWVRHGRPRLQKVQTFLARIEQTINGRPAEYDAYGREKSAAIPPLADQQARTQEQLGQLTLAVKTLVEHADEIADVKSRVLSLEKWRADVEHLHGVERVAGHIAQAKVVDAIDKAHERADRSRGAVDEAADDSSSA